jgi:hypothetical protein
MQNKIRKISSILYISIATSNSLAVLPTSIWYVYLFTFGNVASIVPYNTIILILLIIVDLIFFFYSFTVIEMKISIYWSESNP